MGRMDGLTEQGGGTECQRPGACRGGCKRDHAGYARPEGRADDDRDDHGSDLDDRSQEFGKRPSCLWRCGRDVAQRQWAVGQA